MTGRWLTPATVGVMSRKLRSRRRLSANCAPIISWQSPTVSMVDVRVTARQIAVIGLVRFSIHAVGQRSSMSRAMSTKIGMLRSERRIPPGPTESPTDCRIP